MSTTSRCFTKYIHYHLLHIGQCAYQRCLPTYKNSHNFTEETESKIFNVNNVHVHVKLKGNWIRFKVNQKSLARIIFNINAQSCKAPVDNLGNGVLDFNVLFLLFLLLSSKV